MKSAVGILLMATAGLHTIVGLILAFEPLQAIAAAGGFNAVDPHFDRMAAFWFLSFGVILFLLGLLTDWAVRQTGTLPAGLGWGLIAFGVVGVYLIPVSGIWLVFPIAFLILRLAKKPALHLETG